MVYEPTFVSGAKGYDLLNTTHILQQILPAGEIVGLHGTQNIITTSASEWNDFVLEHTSLAPMETPEHHQLNHFFTIQLGPPATLEIKERGRFVPYTIETGGVCFVPSHMPTQIRFQFPAEILNVAINDSVFAEVSAETGGSEYSDFHPSYNHKDSQLHRLTSTLHEELLAGSPTGRVFTETIKRAIALRTLHSFGTPTPVRSRARNLTVSALRQVTDFVRDNIENDLSLSQIAALAAMSPFHFARCFKKSTGQSVHQFVIAARIARAKTLLHQGISGSSVASQVGFADQSHLIRHFKRATGVTPKRFVELSKNLP